ncbi:MAG: response regulator transcription factor [Anaerolineales bacterium]|nr:response regulator transcription factor [Anaerolineales bacterium]
MNEPLVLVVDDEQTLRKFVRRNLEVRGFRVLTATNGIEALSTFEQHSIDLVILDVMMPRLDGLETTRRIRQHSQVPIIVLTALGEESDKVRAFDLGADDYLTKPFGVAELLARVRAVLRRAQWAPTSPPIEGTLVYGEIEVNVDRREVLVRGEPVKLTPTEFNLLVYLMTHVEKVLEHKAILQQVWGPEYGQETEYLRVYTGHLRQKIEKDPSHPEYLHTERGIGYCFHLRQVE